VLGQHLSDVGDGVTDRSVHNAATAAVLHQYVWGDGSICSTNVDSSVSSKVKNVCCMHSIPLLNYPENRRLKKKMSWTQNVCYVQL